MPRQASINRRADGNYCRSIVVGRKPDGRPIRKYIYAKTIKELDRRAAEYEQQLRRGTLSVDENARFDDLAAAWLSTSKPTVSDGVRRRYRCLIEKHLHELSAFKAKDLKPMHLEAIISRMVEEGYAKKTLQEVKQAAAAVLNFGMKNDIVFRNVFAQVDVPDIDAAEREPVSEEIQQLITRAWQGHRMGVPALIMLYCGLRRGELLALTWRDVDLKKKIITVNKAITFYGNQADVKAPKTKAGNRSVPIPDAILPPLSSARQAGGMLVCAAQRSGGMMTNTGFLRAWESYQAYLNHCAGGKAAERGRPAVLATTPFTAHQLRHTYATMLYDAGVDILTAQRLLGHADVQTTMRIYTHLSKQKEQQSIAALNTLVSNRNAAISMLKKS